MKKVLFLLLFTCLGLGSFEQENIGLKLGMNASTVRSSNGYSFDVLIDVNTGLITKFKLNDKLRLNTELLLSNKGFTSLLIPSGTTATNLTYLSIPALLEYQARKNVYFQLGPELNFLINARMKNSRFNESVSDDYTVFDLALAGGAGIMISRHFLLETRYSFGLSQISQNKDVAGSSKTRTLQINLVYLFKPKN